MNTVLDYFRKKLGWCPNASTFRTAPVILTAPSYTADASAPGGGSSGSGRLDRGVNLALGSLRILFGNRQLLWFSFLTGLVIVFSFVATYALQYFSGINPVSGFGIDLGSPAVFIAQGSPAWLALTFTSQFIVVFCSSFLLAGLVSCVSLLFAGKTASVYEGLSAAGDHLDKILGWAAVYAVVATVQSVVAYLYPENILLLLFAGVLFLPLGFLTMFVIPVIVLEGRSLAGAVAGSIALIRKTWGEVLVCIMVYLVVWFVVAVFSLIPAIAIGFPSGDPGLIGFSMALYLLVLMVMTMVYSTAVGIFLVGLYRYARTGSIPGLFEGKPAAGWAA